MENRITLQCQAPTEEEYYRAWDCVRRTHERYKLPPIEVPTYPYRKAPSMRFHFSFHFDSRQRRTEFQLGNSTRIFYWRPYSPGWFDHKGIWHKSKKFQLIRLVKVTGQWQHKSYFTRTRKMLSWNPLNWLTKSEAPKATPSSPTPVTLRSKSSKTSVPTSPSSSSPKTPLVSKLARTKRMSTKV